MTWEAEFRERIIRFLVRQGAPVDVRPRSYGWIDSDWERLIRHMRGCEPDLPQCTWTDSEWQEFDGTFADPPWSRRTGIDAIVTCRCGEISGRRWRYEGSHAALMRGITEEPDAGT